LETLIGHHVDCRVEKKKIIDKEQFSDG